MSASSCSWRWWWWWSCWWSPWWCRCTPRAPSRRRSTASADPDDEEPRDEREPRVELLGDDEPREQERHEPEREDAGRVGDRDGGAEEERVPRLAPGCPRGTRRRAPCRGRESARARRPRRPPRAARRGRRRATGRRARSATRSRRRHGQEPAGPRAPVRFRGPCPARSAQWPSARRAARRGALAGRHGARPSGSRDGTDAATSRAPSAPGRSPRASRSGRRSVRSANVSARPFAGAPVDRFEAKRRQAPRAGRSRDAVRERARAARGRRRAVSSSARASSAA